MSVFAQWQPFVDGVYTCSGGRSAAGFDSTVVRAPLGSFYDPSFAAGAREGLRILAPLVLGLDPRQHDVRDVAVELGLGVTVEDTGGAQVDTATIAHLSLSTPESARTHTVDFHR